MMTFVQRLAASLKILRTNKKLTQEKFAELCNVDYNSYRKWETGKNSPSADNIDKICSANKIDIIDLLLLSNPIKADKQTIIDDITAKLHLLGR